MQDEQTVTNSGQQPLLSLASVTKQYGDLKAVNAINLTVQAGEWLAIMGPSGSGKSTLMNIIGCMDRPSFGQVWLDGIELTSLNSKQLTEIRRDKIGLVFQQFHLVSYLTAVENVMLAQYYHSVPDKQEALAALDKVGLLDRAKHLPAQLSGGEQQRVCIARALINQPKLILADEPTGNLDEHNEALVLGLFKQLHAQGATIIVVTHDQTVGLAAQKKIVLQHGVIAKTEINAKKFEPPVLTQINQQNSAQIVTQTPTLTDKEVLAKSHDEAGEVAQQLAASAAEINNDNPALAAWWEAKLKKAAKRNNK